MFLLQHSLVLIMNRDFSWSPTDNLVAYWVPGRDPIPAKIIIIELPSRKEVCTKSRQDVKEVCCSYVVVVVIVVLLLDCEKTLCRGDGSPLSALSSLLSTMTPYPKQYLLQVRYHC